MGSDARRTLELAASEARTRLAPTGEAVSAARLTALLELGRALRALGDKEAGKHLRAAIDVAESLRDRLASRLATIELGAWLASTGGDRETGRATLERALDAANRSGDSTASRDAALAASELALVRAAWGDTKGADVALEMARAATARAPQASARHELCAALVLRQREPDEARPGFERALEASRSLRDPIERAAIELAASEALEDGSPSPEDLEALQRADLEALLLASTRVSQAGSDRATVLLDEALRLTGARGAQLVSSGATIAQRGAWEGPSLEVARGGLRLGLSCEKDRKLGPREAATAKILLGHLGGESRELQAASSRILALLEKVLEVGLDLDRIVAVATDLAVSATGAARGFLLFREPGSRLGFRSARQGGLDLADPAGVVSRSLVREVFLSGRAILLADAASDPSRAEAESIGKRGLRSVLVAPILDGDPPSAQGLLYLDDPGTVGRFGPAEREVACGFAARLGPVLRSVMQGERDRAAAASAREALAAPRARPALKHPFPEIVGRSRALARALLLLDRAVESTAPVLISGESGTGKEVFARSLHASGPRAKGPFVALSCGALADTVLESELFGHVAGAFTGAADARKGAFEEADSGTLFLDDIQEASPKLQADLLRVIETGELRPLGGGKTRKVDVRLVTAAKTDLAALVAADSFRQDLYYRVNVLRIEIPPLRERIEDIPELVAHFLARAPGGPRELAPGVLEKIVAASWPGNVRSLRNCLDRAFVAAPTGPIRAEHLELETRSKPVLPSRERGGVYAGSIELNERQLALLDRLRKEGEIGNMEYSESEGVSQPTGWRDLTDLVAKGVLVRAGRGKRTVYRLAPGWEARLSGG